MKCGEIGIIIGYKRRKPTMSVTKHGSFTLAYSGNPFSMAIVKQGDKIVNINTARWDTGSEYTYIDVSKAKSLVSDGNPGSMVSGVNSTYLPSNDYDVTIILPGGIEISGISVGDLDLSNLKNCEAIIGMDIITQGKLTVEKNIFSFEI